ncbi:unnamed protein product, partial [Menidia menidia]
TAFNGSGGPTDSAKTQITSHLRSFLCLLDLNMLLTIRDCTVHEARRTNPSWQMSVYKLLAFLAILFRRAAMGYIGPMRHMWANKFGIADIISIMPQGERLSENVVLKLMEPFLDKGRTVAMDNFITSLSLANRLLQRNTTLLGTINKIRRELPATAKETSGRQLHSTQVFKSGSALLTVYATKKKKSVCLLSTMHHKVEIVDIQKQKTNTVVDYNHLKCGVDQKLRNYSVRAATRRWPMAVFYNLLDMAATNAHVLYTACTGSKESRRLFMLELSEELKNRFLQEKTQEEQQKQLRCEMRVSQQKKTQCQVRILCNKNKSTERCVHCGKFTCGKCRKGSPWECGYC